MRIAALLLALAATSCYAVEVKPPSPIPRDRLVHLYPTQGERVFVLPWSGPTTLPPQVEVVTLSDNSIAFVGPPGLYVVLSITDTGQSQQFVTIGDTGPIPPPPVPPGPTPPIPPGPTPGEVPFPATGFSVMILRESSATGAIPAEQRAIFTSSQVLGYLTSKCVKLPNGTPAARVWDPSLTDAQLANADPAMAIAYRLTKQAADGKDPWICISTGSSGYSGPLPANIADTLTLLKKFGG